VKLNVVESNIVIGRIIKTKVLIILPMTYAFASIKIALSLCRH